MRAYTVSQLARMAGVSVRTLHHYDQIGLLHPTARTAAGYRVYVERDLLRLQQILLYRELELPLSEVRTVLDDPHFDQVRALRQHRQALLRRREQLSQLLATIDKTIDRLTKGDKTMMTDEELYEGIAPETVERWKREVREKYDPALVAESNRRVGRMSKEQWKAIKAEGDEVTRGLAALAGAGRAPDDPGVQALVARHHAWIENFYLCSAEIYRGLGQLYVENPEFHATYDRYRPNLAEFMQAAMNVYADRVLDKKG